MGALRVMSYDRSADQLPLPPPVPAAAATDARERYATAHLAALRAAAAVLAARTRPESGRRRPRSAWVLLGDVCPELGEWATFFAAGAAKRAAAEAGLSRAVTEREADDLVRDVESFLGVVETTLTQLPEPAPRPRVVGGTAHRGTTSRSRR